jgi:phosphodiesterase/alkaline phosphatase D-like protein
VRSRAAVIQARLPAGESVRFKVRPLVSTPGFAQPIVDARVMPTNPGLREFRITGLAPGTRWEASVESASATGDAAGTTRASATWQTYPEGVASFAFAFASCARSGSDHAVFDTIRKRQPLFYACLGDLHYENVARAEPSAFRAAWDRVLASPRQAALYRSVPWHYVWDDHDFCGDTSNGSAPAGSTAQAVFREYMPSARPWISEKGTVEHAFSVGRVRFVLTDLRSASAPASAVDGAGKSMMGSSQRDWFFEELRSANQSHGLIIWGSSVPWIGKSGRKGDSWSVFNHERALIARFIRDEKIRNLVILCGDAHMLAADSGANSNPDKIMPIRVPVYHGSSLDQRSSLKGGPYSEGYYRPAPGEGCFGWVSITDTGSRIEVAFTGRNHMDEMRVQHTSVFG